MDNDLSVLWYQRGRDCPGKVWFYAEWRPAPIYRALRIDPAEDGATYAITPFRIARIAGDVLVLAAYPAPFDLNEPDVDWLGIETVLAWNPLTDRAHILGGEDNDLVGRLADEANQIFASPRAFFQTWAAKRAQFYVMQRAARLNKWGAIPTERDEVPGALLVGSLDKVRLCPGLLPDHIECVGMDAKDLNRAIMRAANLPRVSAKTLRIAA